MANTDLHAHMTSLARQPATEKVNTFQQISEEWKKLDATTIKSLLSGCTFALPLSEVLDENIGSWTQNWPAWIDPIMDKLFNYTGEKNLQPFEHMKALVASFRKYVLRGCFDAMLGLAILANYIIIAPLLVSDDELISLIKKSLPKKNTIRFLRSVAVYEEWQTKLISDKKFIIDLASLPESEDVWRVLLVLAQHPDAKERMPRLVLAKANNSALGICTGICALLANETDLNVVKVNSAWVEQRINLLKTLLDTGLAEEGTARYSLINLVLPIANLSTVDSQKEVVGKQVVELLLRILSTAPLPKTFLVQNYLVRGRQEASKALGNFAYLESNRALISNADGITKLKDAMEKIDDPITKKNIEAILQTFAPPKEESKVENTSLISPSETKGHVMISYNWANQSKIIRIAKALRERGITVWLDVDHMGGSTLAAMADAVEKAELVLMCMSQKYKDSLNCRLEGEYCVNRKVNYIPLMMQQEYRPDGWLGIALGAKLYYDFTDESNWDSSIGNLVKEIGTRGKGQVNMEAVPEFKKGLVDWTDADILEWMNAAHIEQFYTLFQEHGIDGRALGELKYLQSSQQTSLSFSFDSICQDLGITKTGDKLRFSAAIRKL